MSTDETHVAHDPNPGRHDHRDRTEPVLQPRLKRHRLFRRGPVGGHGLAGVIVGMELESLLPKPSYDNLDVVPGAERHLVTDPLGLTYQSVLTHAVAVLTELVPNLFALPTAISIQPPLRCHAPILTHRTGQRRTPPHSQAAGSEARPCR